MVVDIVIDQKKLQRAIRRVPKVLAAETRKAFFIHGEVFRSAMIRTRFTGGQGKLHTRTGKLQRSLRTSVRGKKLSNLRLLVTIGGGVASKYAGIQEFGGTIHGNPWLTIPLPDNKTAGGDVRFKSAAALRDSSAHSTFIFRTPGGAHAIIARRVGKKLQFLWVLKRSVTLKPRLGFFALWRSRKMRTHRIRLFRTAVRRALKQAGR